MTGHNEEKRTPEALRKEQQRERERELGILVVEVKLGPREREMLAEGCKVRGGVRGAYESAEYVATLIRRDHARLAEQSAAPVAAVCADPPADSAATYGPSEYVADLVRLDNARLSDQLAELSGSVCGFCGYALPEGCGGRRLGESPCWHTHDARGLEL